MPVNLKGTPETFLGNFTVATLPTTTPSASSNIVAAIGDQAFATNALKVGETTGNGTGTLVYRDATAWRRVGDDTTVAA